MIHLDFPGIRPQAKRNSQFRNGYAYVEPHYRAWRNMVAAVARGQWLRTDFTMREPLSEPMAVSVTFRTASGILRGDLDNAFAGLMDALQAAEVIENDKLIRRLSAEVVKVPRKDVGISVSIEQI